MLAEVGFWGTVMMVNQQNDLITDAFNKSNAEMDFAPEGSYLVEYNYIIHQGRETFHFYSFDVIESGKWEGDFKVSGYWED